jgi:hypothetical protein
MNDNQVSQKAVFVTAQAEMMRLATDVISIYLLRSHGKQRIAERSFAPSSRTMEFGVLDFVAVCSLFIVRETMQ